MKILYPQGEANDAEIEEVLRIAIEGRKRVKDQLLRIDSSYPAVRFSYFSQDVKEHLVTTLEEQEYPRAYHRETPSSVVTQTTEEGSIQPLASSLPPQSAKPVPEAPPVKPTLEESHLVFQENQRGVNFDQLFGLCCLWRSLVQTYESPSFYYCCLGSVSKDEIAILEGSFNLKFSQSLNELHTDYFGNGEPQNMTSPLV